MIGGMEMPPEEAAIRTARTGVNLHDLMSELRQAPVLDLLPLRPAIDHLLQSPSRILAVRQHLHLGQEIHFWNLRDNRMQHGRITQFKSDQLLILAENPSQYWWVPYAAIQRDPKQVPPPEPPRPLGRADFALGDTVAVFRRSSRWGSRLATHSSSWRV